MNKTFKSLAKYSLIIALLILGTSIWQNVGQNNGNIKQMIGRIPQIENQSSVLRFITETCKICSFENDNIKRAESISGVNIVNIMVGPISSQNFTAYIEKHQLDPQKTILDTQGDLFRKAEGKAVPLTFFLDSEGNIHHRSIGYTTTLGLIFRNLLSRIS